MSAKRMMPLTGGSLSKRVRSHSVPTASAAAASTVTMLQRANAESTCTQIFQNEDTLSYLWIVALCFLICFLSLFAGFMLGRWYTLKKIREPSHEATTTDRVCQITSDLSKVDPVRFIYLSNKIFWGSKHLDCEPRDEVSLRKFHLFTGCHHLSGKDEHGGEILKFPLTQFELCKDCERRARVEASRISPSLTRGLGAPVWSGKAESERTRQRRKERAKASAAATAYVEEGGDTAPAVSHISCFPVD